MCHWEVTSRVHRSSLDPSCYLCFPLPQAKQFSSTMPYLATDPENGAKLPGIETLSQNLFSPEAFALHPLAGHYCYLKVKCCPEAHVSNS